MLANPIVEEVMLAAPTAELAMERFAVDNVDTVVRIPGCASVWGFGVLRIAPPLKVARRFRGYVTWLPKAKARKD